MRTELRRSCQNLYPTHASKHISFCPNRTYTRVMTATFVGRPHSCGAMPPDQSLEKAQSSGSDGYAYVRYHLGRRCNIPILISDSLSHRTSAPTTSFLGPPPPPGAKADCYTGSTLSSPPRDTAVSFFSCYQTVQKEIQDNRNWEPSLAACGNSLLHRDRDERRLS